MGPVLEDLPPIKCSLCNQIAWCRSRLLFTLDRKRAHLCKTHSKQLSNPLQRSPRRKAIRILEFLEKQIPIPGKIKRHHFPRKPSHTHEDHKEYARLRLQFLKDNPWCEVSLKRDHGAKVPANVIHHRKGRGDHYLDVSTFVATTRDGDCWIHRHPEKARELGLLE